MSKKSTKKLLFVATCVFTSVILIISTVGNSWISMDTKVHITRGSERSVRINEGLWKVCIYSENHYQQSSVLTGCNTIEFVTEQRGGTNSENTIEGWFYACRAFSVVACLLSLLAVLFILVDLKRSMEHTRLMVSITYITAAVFIVIAIILYTVQFEKATEFASGETLIPVDTDYGWSYILAWIGLILCGGHSVTVYFVVKKNPYRI